MQYTILPKLGDKVSKICLGTMTWGQQNDEGEAHQQMDFALEHGVNFWDTAEMYPSPPNEEKSGDTERFVGTWFAKTGKRNDVVLASKISPMSYLRGGNTRFNAKHISEALDGNLKRLQTDHIDIYQLHWPERETNYFGTRGYTEDMAQQDLSDLTPFLETIEALNDEIKKGRIRAWGLSNDTPWGVMRYLWEADKAGLDAPITVQNPYSLLNRLYEVGLAEISHRENVGLLAYSPLGFGVLSGKYLGGRRPEGASSHFGTDSNVISTLRQNGQPSNTPALLRMQGWTWHRCHWHCELSLFVTANIIGQPVSINLKPTLIVILNRAMTYWKRLKKCKRSNQIRRLS